MAEINGSAARYFNERIDKVQLILDQVAADHLVFLQGHERLVQSHEKLANAQLAQGEKLNILLSTVDDWFRRQSK